MSQSGSQAAAFFREVAGHRTVWFVRDDDGMPSSRTSSGERACAYWSSRARAERAAEIWGNGLRVESFTLDFWRGEELPALAGEGFRVGINWTGPRLTGWDFAVDEVLNRLGRP